MNVQWKIINLFFCLQLCLSGTIKYSIDVHKDFGKENDTWHPKLSRAFLEDGSFELVDERFAVYKTSLIQIQNKFLGSSTPKLQCGCRFVKDTDDGIIRETTPEPVKIPEQSNTITIPTKPVVQDVKESVIQAPPVQTTPPCDNDMVKALTKRLEENNNLMEKINTYLGGQTQKVNQPMMAPYQQAPPMMAFQQPIPQATIYPQYPYMTSPTIPTATINPYPLYTPYPYIPTVTPTVMPTVMPTIMQ